MARDPLVPVADFGFSGWKMEDFSWSFRGLGSDSFFEAAMMMGDDDDIDMSAKSQLTSHLSLRTRLGGSLFIWSPP